MLFVPAHLTTLPLEALDMPVSSRAELLASSEAVTPSNVWMSSIYHLNKTSGGLASAVHVSLMSPPSED